MHLFSAPSGEFTFSLLYFGLQNILESLCLKHCVIPTLIGKDSLGASCLTGIVGERCLQLEFWNLETHRGRSVDPVK